jgi:transcriptional regulator with XRE-family HTH domain
MMKRDPQVLVGQAIRARRLALGLSQDHFADAIGMHRAYYSSLERGVRNLTINTLLKVAEGLGVTGSQILEDAKL